MKTTVSNGILKLCDRGAILCGEKQEINWSKRLQTNFVCPVWRFVCSCLAALMSLSRNVHCCQDSSPSWRLYFAARFERAVLLLSLSPVADAALRFCRWFLCRLKPSVPKWPSRFHVSHPVWPTAFWSLESYQQDCASPINIRKGLQLLDRNALRKSQAQKACYVSSIKKHFFP